MKGLITLPPELNINAVGQLTETAKNILSKEDEVTLDAQNVEVIDALGLQLIFSIQKTALINNVKFKIINVKPSLQRYISLLQ